MRRPKVIPPVRRVAGLVLLGILPALSPADLHPSSEPPASAEPWMVIDRLPEEGFFLEARDFEVRRIVLRSVVPAAEATWAQKCLVYATPLPLLRQRIEERLDKEPLLAEAYCPPDTRFDWRAGRALDGKQIVVHFQGQKLYVFAGAGVGTIPVEVQGEVYVSFRHGTGTLFPSAAASPWAPAGLPPVPAGRLPLWRRR